MNTHTTHTPAASPTALAPFEVFRVGTHQTHSGECLSFSAADLAAIAASYRADTAPAPIVVGHPQLDDPAFGWVDGFTVNGDVLVATPKEVDPQFAAMVREGKFRKVSIALFRPDEPSNPVPGTWYPRHVGMLGAAAPAVPGLKPVVWTANANSVEFSAEFSNPRFIQRQELGWWRRLREWLIAKHGAADADQVIPDYELTSAQEDAVLPDPEPIATQQVTYAAPVPHQPTDKESVMSEQDKQELERLRAENQRLQEQQAAVELAARKEKITTVVQKLKAAGKVPAAEAETLIQFATGLSTETTVEFAAADGKSQVKQSAADYLLGLLERLPQVVPVGPSQAALPLTPATAFAAPHGSAIDQERLVQHQQIEAYAAEHKCSYIDAARALNV